MMKLLPDTDEDPTHCIAAHSCSDCSLTSEAEMKSLSPWSWRHRAILNVVLADASPLECEIHLPQPPDPSLLSGQMILNCVPWTRCMGLRGEALKEKIMWMLSASTSGRVLTRKSACFGARMKLPFFCLPTGKITLAVSLSFLGWLHL